MLCERAGNLCRRGGNGPVPRRRGKRLIGSSKAERAEGIFCSRRAEVARGPGSFLEAAVRAKSGPMADGAARCAVNKKKQNHEHRTDRQMPTGTQPRAARGGKEKKRHEKPTPRRRDIPRDPRDGRGWVGYKGARGRDGNKKLQRVRGPGCSQGWALPRLDVFEMSLAGHAFL